MCSSQKPLENPLIFVPELHLKLLQEFFLSLRIAFSYAQGHLVLYASLPSLKLIYLACAQYLEAAKHLCVDEGAHKGEE